MRRILIFLASCLLSLVVITLISPFFSDFMLGAFYIGVSNGIYSELESR